MMASDPVPETLQDRTVRTDEYGDGRLQVLSINETHAGVVIERSYETMADEFRTPWVERHYPDADRDDYDPEQHVEEFKLDTLSDRTIFVTEIGLAHERDRGPERAEDTPGQFIVCHDGIEAYTADERTTLKRAAGLSGIYLTNAGKDFTICIGAEPLSSFHKESDRSRAIESFTEADYVYFTM